MAGIEPIPVRSGNTGWGTRRSSFALGSIENVVLVTESCEMTVCHFTRRWGRVSGYERVHGEGQGKAATRATAVNWAAPGEPHTLALACIPCIPFRTRMKCKNMYFRELSAYSRRRILNEAFKLGPQALPPGKHSKNIARSARETSGVPSRPPARNQWCPDPSASPKHACPRQKSCPRNSFSLRTCKLCQSVCSESKRSLEMTEIRDLTSCTMS